MTELDITLRDGRTLHVYDYGDSDGNVLIEHHGTPGSGLAFPRDLELARERGLRSIRYDRAGYGGSTPNPGRSVVDVVADIDDVLDVLGIERYVTLGGSGGCPHSFACGARSERCLAAAAIAPPAPYAAEGLDWLAGQGDANQVEWAAALDGPEALEAYIEGEAAKLRAITPEQIKEGERPAAGRRCRSHRRPRRTCEAKSRTRSRARHRGLAR